MKPPARPVFCPDSDAARAFKTGPHRNGITGRAHSNKLFSEV